MLICATLASFIELARAFVHLVCIHSISLFAVSVIMNVGTCAFFKHIPRPRRTRSRHLRESSTLVQDNAIA